MKIDEDRNFECTTCGHVEMRLTLLEHYNQSGERVLRVLHSIEDYGECSVASDASGVPTFEQLENCPVAVYLFANKDKL